MEQAAFRALADPARRKIMRLLAERDMRVADVAAHFDMTRAAVKKHLDVLEAGGLITTRVQGRERINSLEMSGLAPVCDWIGFFDQFWDQRLKDLKKTIEGN